jgi:prepilin-type N-terminal cleavage/methylation domain-containing protein/prepilin-type processing-associated H-X9-DG protein
MRKKAFTLVELLVVIAVIAVLISVLVPVLSKAKQQGMRVVCMSNLRQMVIAAETYAATNSDYYPLAQAATERLDGKEYQYVWDFITVTDTATGSSIEKPGLLWQGDGICKIQQCPDFKGNDNWGGQQFTGYNYNASYIGGHYWKGLWTGGEIFVRSTKVSQIKRPYQCAIFGDGEYSGGANKFMRSPFAGRLDASFGDSNRWAGTQGYRHLEATNVSYCDGSAKYTRKRYTITDKLGMPNIAKGTGFLSADNSAYDLE